MKPFVEETLIAGMPEKGIPERNKREIEYYEKECPVSSGRTQYIRYLNGGKLTYREAVLAKCAECNLGYIDGRYDCAVSKCPLYQFMPYRGNNEE